MKKILILISAMGAILLGASCSKINDRQQAETQAGSGEMVSLNISLSGLVTKATDSSVEKDRAVSSIQVLVFNAKNETEGYCKATSKDNIPDITVSHGNKTIWAVVNYSADLSKVLNLQELKSHEILLEKNAVGALIMTGTVAKNVTTLDHSVNITVSHLTSKVTVTKVSRDFPVYAQAQKAMTINGIYIINAVGGCCVDGTLTSTWYNKLGHNSAVADPVLYDAVGSALANEASYTTVHAFYPYPNSNENLTVTDTWSDRKSLLVIDTTLGGEASYYPIWIPKTGPLQANKHYEITDIKLTKPGSTSPFEPVTTEDVSVTIQVTDFVTGETYTETI